MSFGGGLYRARLGAARDEAVRRYISSIETDVHFLDQEITASEAHAVALLKQRLLDRQEAKAILKALEELRIQDRRINSKAIEDYEDVHEFVESFVIKKSGEAGKKLHTGRSRNDQVATITRMKVRDQLTKTASMVAKLTSTLLKRAGKESRIPMIYYTHLQHAQIGSFGHYWLAQTESLIRDLERMMDAYARTNRSPLGSSACAGSRISIDRNLTANLLGFDSLVENSLDAVTTRDFVFETMAVLSNLMIDLSRICQDLIIWSSSEFGYVSLSDQFASTSSIMPHKKNPDPLELAKAKCGETVGLLAGVGDILKGLPSGYNRDLQEVKPLILQAFQIANESVKILDRAVSTVKVNMKRLSHTLETTEAYAIELVEWLVEECKVPLRDAHTAVGKIVRSLYKSGRSLNKVDSPELRRLLRRKGINIEARKNLREIFDPHKALRDRKTSGSPNPSESQRMIRVNRKKVKQVKALIQYKTKKIGSSLNELNLQIRTILEYC